MSILRGYRISLPVVAPGWPDNIFFAVAASIGGDSGGVRADSIADGSTSRPSGRRRRRTWLNAYKPRCTSVDDRP